MSQLCLFLATDEPLQPSAQELAAPTPQHPVVAMAMASVAIGTSGARENKEHLYQALAHLLQKRWALARPKILGSIVAAAAVSAALCEGPEPFSTNFSQDCVAGAEFIPSPAEAISAEFCSPPSMPLQQFLKKVHRGVKCSAECFPIALAMLDRYYRSTHERIDKTTAPRLMLVALMVATKLRDDRFYKNSVWADVGGVPLVVLNALEVKFLSAVRYEVFVSAEDYLEFEGIVLDTIAQFTEDDEGFAAASAVLTPSSSSPQVRTKLGSLCLTPLPTPTLTPMRMRLGQTAALTGSHDSCGPEVSESALPTPQPSTKPQVEKLSLLLGQPLSVRPST